MGKSYKKNPFAGVTKTDGRWKKVFNRRLRRVPIDFYEGVSALQDGCAFKRANETWEISDGKMRAPRLDEWWGTPFEYRKLFYCK